MRPAGRFKNFQQLRATTACRCCGCKPFNGVDERPERDRKEIVSAQCIRCQVEILASIVTIDVMNTVL